jgi:hypothetical protein
MPCEMNADGTPSEWCGQDDCGTWGWCEGDGCESDCQVNKLRIRQPFCYGNRCGKCRAYGCGEMTPPSNWTLGCHSTAFCMGSYCQYENGDNLIPDRRSQHTEDELFHMPFCAAAHCTRKRHLKWDGTPHLYCSRECANNPNGGGHHAQLGPDNDDDNDMDGGEPGDATVTTTWTVAVPTTALTTTRTTAINRPQPQIAATLGLRAHRHLTRPRKITQTTAVMTAGMTAALRAGRVPVPTAAIPTVHAACRTSHSVFLTSPAPPWSRCLFSQTRAGARRMRQRGATHLPVGGVRLTPRACAGHCTLCSRRVRHTNRTGTCSTERRRAKARTTRPTWCF